MKRGGGWWGSLVDTSDPDVQRIDAMEAALGVVPPPARDVRLLIARLEMCHHKVPRHIDVIVQAIGDAHTDNVPVDTYPCPPNGRLGPEQQRWRDLARILRFWREDVPLDTAVERCPHLEDDIRDTYGRLGERTPLKRWQVGHLQYRIMDHVTREVTYRYIAEDEPPSEFKSATVAQPLLVDSPTDLNLAVAIDNTEPCNWRFEENLRMVLDTIGGRAGHGDFFAAHGTNVAQRPYRREARHVVTALDAWSRGEPVADTEQWIADKLGERTPVKAWLAASLGKTIAVQMQLSPPDRKDHP